MKADGEPELGVVVIGRNEGARLRRSLMTIAPLGYPYVYVDSGSIDDSLCIAEELGAETISLTPDAPFTAARGRNAGFRHLCSKYRSLRYVQFVDGDCELTTEWLPAAVRFLAERPDVAIVCGELKERHPDASIYNALCELEWAGPTGEIGECGGIALMRAEPVMAVDGYREDLISGEEPDLCFRLRRSGWHIWRLPVQMAWHDAGMTRFAQWWRRMVRSGHGYTRGLFYVDSPERRACIRHVSASLLWGAALPLGILLTAALWNPMALLLLVIYPLQIARIKWRASKGGLAALGWTRALFTVLDKFPHAIGILKFLSQHATNRRPQLIEYK